MQETRVQFLGQEDPWRRKWQPTPVLLPGESPWTEEPGGLQSMGSQESDTTWRLNHLHHKFVPSHWCLRLVVYVFLGFILFHVGSYCNVPWSILIDRKRGSILILVCQIMSFIFLQLSQQLKYRCKKQVVNSSRVEILSGGYKTVDRDI